MNDSAAAQARPLLVPALALTAAVWGILLFSSDDPVLGVGTAHSILQTAAIAITAVLAVLVAGTTILSIAPSITGEPATGFQRVIVYALLTFGATFVTLRYLGFDLGAVLTTSAIVTAAVGFAMQPTLSSMIAGLALHADRAVHVGDCVMLDGECVEIVSMNWRAALGRRPDSRMIVIPNTKLTDVSTEVLRAGVAHRAEFTFLGPIDHPPQQICDLVREAVSDLAIVDQELPVQVAPVGFEPEQESVRFRVQYWTRIYADRALIEGETIRRVWYLFQRNRIAFPHPTACALSAGARNDLEAQLAQREDIVPAIETWLTGSRPGLINARKLAEAVSKSARLLLYAPDERVILPEWSNGWIHLSLRGIARVVPEFDLSPEMETVSSALAVRQLGPTAEITRLADELSRLIGPYAKMAVIRAGDRSQTYQELCRKIAEEIDDPEKRDTFLRRLLPEEIPAIRPGAIIAARRNASGYLTAEPSLRAQGELALLAIPGDVLMQIGGLSPAATG